MGPEIEREFHAARVKPRCINSSTLREKRVNPQSSFVRGGLMSLAACVGFFGVLWTHAEPRPAQAMRDKTPPAAHEMPAVPAEIKPAPMPAFPVNPEYPLGYNFALASNGGTATGGSDPGQLIDGNDSNYSGGTGFAMTQWRATPPQAFVITLKKAVTLDAIRVLLWDRAEERYYRYKLEVCADEKGAEWTMVSDRSGPIEQCKSWQVLRFKAQTVKQIKLTGTFNSANNGFHVVELQAFNGCPPAAPSVSTDSLDF